jgi:hypothetical protein
VVAGGGFMPGAVVGGVPPVPGCGVVCAMTAGATRRAAASAIAEVFVRMRSLPLMFIATTQFRRVTSQRTSGSLFAAKV